MNLFNKQAHKFYYHIRRELLEGCVCMFAKNVVHRIGYFATTITKLEAIHLKEFIRNSFFEIWFFGEKTNNFDSDLLLL